MAKDNREILHAIRTPAMKDGVKPRLFKSGMEDELAAALSQDELDKAVERGDLTGDWKHISAKAAEKAAKDKE